MGSSLSRSSLVPLAPVGGATPAVRPAASIVVPFLDEASNLPTLIMELRAVVDDLDRATEVVFVDDGSTDDSAEVVRRAIAEDPRFRLVRLERNYGKSAAIAAGRDAARGDVIITLDADLQDPPEAIPRFLAEIDRGSDVVAGWRKGRRGPLHRRIFSALFNAFTTRVTGVRIHDVNSGFKAYRRHVLEALHLSRGMHRFTAIIADGYGYRVSEVVAPHRDRLSGRTKFGVFRYVETLLGFLAAIYVRRALRSPVAGIGTLGGALLVLALLLGVLELAVGQALLPAAWAWIAVAVLVVLGVQLLVTGVVAEGLLQYTTKNGSHVTPYTLRSEPAEGEE